MSYKPFNYIPTHHPETLSDRADFLSNQAHKLIAADSEQSIQDADSILRLKRIGLTIVMNGTDIVTSDIPFHDLRMKFQPEEPLLSVDLKSRVHGRGAVIYRLKDIGNDWLGAVVLQVPSEGALEQVAMPLNELGVQRVLEFSELYLDIPPQRTGL